MMKFKILTIFGDEAELETRGAQRWIKEYWSSFSS